MYWSTSTPIAILPFSLAARRPPLPVLPPTPNTTSQPCEIMDWPVSLPLAGSVNDGMYTFSVFTSGLTAFAPFW